ncbi:heme-binding domain-containing protein [Chitinophaga sp. RCC_12]|uniref:heme-binding domain-containing protein n=1 Tax=Chitinophaga sp. RCC_12 TaxID=3239226 RepID=UPI0035269FE2
MKLSFWKTRSGLVIALFILMVTAMQFIGQPVQNHPVTAPIKAPEEVLGILKRACYDCHSNETKLSWYDHIAPVSWLVAADVTEARSRFNFSTWDTLSSADQQGRLWEMVNMVLTGKMPLSTYTATHPQSKLSAKDITVLKEYVTDISPSKYHDTTIISEAAREFQQFRQQSLPPTGNPVAANGVAYTPGYREWQVISTTNRFDNHSIRVVYGNALAAKAIRDNRINPFPEGSTIVKVVWNSIEEKNGDIIPGSLNSVQIMTKDNQRFADSEGWGFAKFNGIALKPYGSTPMFNTTCFNCHKIASANDYVFNLPLVNNAPKPAREMFDAGNLHVITSFANRQQQTMSVLYGNTAAQQSALAGYKTHTPGEIFRLVTYKQAGNKYWYGSYINGEVQTVEMVSGDADKLTYKLERGHWLVNNAGDKVDAAVRINDIFSQRPSVFP